jgi:hypothetical protein
MISAALKRGPSGAEAPMKRSFRRGVVPTTTPAIMPIKGGFNISRRTLRAEEAAPSAESRRKPTLQSRGEYTIRKSEI